MLKPFSEEEILGEPDSGQQKKELLTLEDSRYENFDSSAMPQTLELLTGTLRRKTFQPSPRSVNVKAIRSKTGLSQAEFARRYGFNVRTLQDWESSGAQPLSAVRAYLTVIDRFPETVEKALKGGV